MKKSTKFIIVFILMFVILIIVISVFYLAPFSGGIKRKSILVSAPEEVYDNKFLHHPEAWNSVFQNVSSIPEFWSATIPASLAEKSIPKIARMFRANVYANSPEYAYCYIAVPENNCGALNQTLTELGFNVKDVAILKPEQRMLLSYMHPHACLAIIEPQKENEKKALAFTGAITGMAETMWK